MRVFCLSILLLTLGVLAPVFSTHSFAADGDVLHRLEESFEQFDRVLDEPLDAGHHGDVHHGDDGHGEVKGLPQLNPEWYLSQIFWLVITFGVMHIAFKFKVLPDLSNVIERRREQIDGDLTAAQNLKEEAERVHAEYDAMLALAREKSSSLFTRVEDKIKEKEQEEFSAFQGKAVKEISETEAEITKAKDVAIKDMNDVAADIALLAADKIVGIRADKKQAASVVASLQKKKAA